MRTPQLGPNRRSTLQGGELMSRPVSSRRASPTGAGAQRRSWPSELISSGSGSGRRRPELPRECATGRRLTPPLVTPARPATWPSGDAGRAPARSSPASARFPRQSREPASTPRPASGSQRVWTRGRIVEAMQRWHGERGRYPTRSDWQKASDWHPAGSTVYRVFGGWEAPLKAARLKAGRRRSSSNHTRRLAAGRREA
jgi:hypothetical protein